MVVLVINEIPDLRKVVRTFFELQGYEVVEAGHPVEAFSQAIEYKPQFVVVDNVVDSIPYLAICKNIQTIPELEAVEFVVLTDFDDELPAVSGINLKGIITKPNIVPKLRNYFPPLK